MGLALQLLLVAGSLISLGFVASRIKKRKILMEDAIFWVVVAVIIFILAIFPQIAFFFAGLFGFMSPSNFIFLLVIALLLAKVFTNSAEISLLKNKVNELSQEIALRDKANKDQ